MGNFKASKACQVKANLGDLLGTYTNHVGLIPNDPSSATYEARKSNGSTLTIGDVTYDKTIGARILVSSLGNLPRDGRMVKANSWLFTEKDTYQMLARGHAPACEPFREWVYWKAVDQAWGWASADAGGTDTGFLY